MPRMDLAIHNERLLASRVRLFLASCEVSVGHLGFIRDSCPWPSLWPNVPSSRWTNLIRAGKAECRYSWRDSRAGREPGAGLIWDFGTAVIGARVRDAGLPAAGDRGVLARLAG